MPAGQRRLKRSWRKRCDKDWREAAARCSDKMGASNGVWNPWQTEHQRIEFMIQSVCDVVLWSSSSRLCQTELSHWPPELQEEQTAERQQLWAWRHRPWPAPVCSREGISGGIIKVSLPPASPHPLSGPGHFFNQSEGEAPGSCSSGLMEGSSLNSQTWWKGVHWGQTLCRFLKH